MLLLEILLILELLMIVAGYLLMITDEYGHIPLNQYRLSGCLVTFIVGMYDGTRLLLARRSGREAIPAALVYGGIVSAAFTLKIIHAQSA